MVTIRLQRTWAPFRNETWYRTNTKLAAIIHASIRRRRTKFARHIFTLTTVSVCLFSERPTDKHCTEKCNHRNGCLPPTPTAHRWWPRRMNIKFRSRVNRRTCCSKQICSLSSMRLTSYLGAENLHAIFPEQQRNALSRGLDKTVPADSGAAGR